MSDSARWQRRSRSSRDTDPSPTPAPKPPAPIILGLARPTVSQHDQDSGTSQSLTQGDSASTNVQADSQHGTARAAGDNKPIFLLKSRDENRGTSAPSASTPVSASADSNTPHSTHPYPTSHAPQPQRHTSTSQQSGESGKNRLVPPTEMKHSIQIIDENFRWIDEGIEDLLDQTDYLVVGAIGLQGAGKSTILSLLAGNTAQDPYRSYIFHPQVKETREDAFHQSVGVEMFASPERIILLDTQPVFSASVMDVLIRQEKKYSQEYSSTETCVEVQSLQIASFLMTVCHVIIVAQDWFTDLTFLRSLLTAEMLRPQTHISSHEGSQSSSHQDDATDFHPTVVFLLNKANQDDFTPETYTDMKLTLHSIFRSSKLHYQGAVNMHKDGIISAVKAKEQSCFVDVNLFLLPTMEYYKAEPESILTNLPEYRGFPSFAFILRSLRNQIYAVPRLPMTPSPLSERNWFHFAARTWEAVKKSQLIFEYNRLLP
ncbi:nonsense-mediated mRNA decay factor SMG9-like [Babylonia areolata]|uniref:nonsense-mediated mRNA decay factor SMG9-like n=1 Tax=Babylonia areolata TaxID=304850 RepID=UPI003FD01DC5